jgi:homoserine O-succinyltransferase/O-acetyltransferase
MPVTIEADRVPAFWTEKMRPGGDRNRDGRAEGVRIALINNMPDPALEDTELQFFELLDAAAGELPVEITLYSLPGIARRERGEERLRRYYHGIDDLWSSQVDAVIMTGTEPHQPDLRQEPYWEALIQVLEWAAENTVSAILSCLAAHAGVLHSDGIARQPLGDKRFGVFASSKACDHVLTSRVSGPIRFPHSRWNEVREEDLMSFGYVILTKSAEAGVDLFAKRRGRSLFVYVQGHPEYGATTLLKEYRRDIRRFLNRERETYPSMPVGYFDPVATNLLTDFREKAWLDPQRESMDSFPDAAVAATLGRTWQSSATQIYHNWLGYVRSRKAKIQPFAPISRGIDGQGHQRRPVVSL